MYVIAKMGVKSVEDYGMSRKVSFGCVYESPLHPGIESPENVSFTKATPSGEGWMTIDNKYVWDAFHPPHDYGQDAALASQHYVVYIPASEFTLEQVQRALSHLSADSTAAASDA